MSICRVELPSFTVEKERKKKTGSSCGFVLDPVYDCKNCLKEKKKEKRRIGAEGGARTNEPFSVSLLRIEPLFVQLCSRVSSEERDTNRERERVVVEVPPRFSVSLSWWGAGGGRRSNGQAQYLRHLSEGRF